LFIDFTLLILLSQITFKLKDLVFLIKNYSLLNKLYFAFLFVSVFLFISCSKNKKNSSFENNISSDSLDIYLSYVNDPTYDSYKKEVSNNKAFEIVNLKPDDSIKEKHLLEIAANYFRLKNYDSFHKASKALLETSRKNKDEKSIAKSYVYLAEYYKKVSKNDSAYFYYLKAEKKFISLNDNSSLADVFIRKADLQSLENDLFGSVKSSSDALSLLRNSSNKRKIYEAYNLIGISSNELKNYEDAINYHKKALKTAEDSDLLDKKYLGAISLNNIGNTYQNINRYRDAVIYFELALKDKSYFTEYPNLYATLLDNLAYSKFKIGNYKDPPSLFNSSLKIREDNEIFDGIIVNKIHLSEYYNAINDSPKSLKLASESLDLARKIKSTGDILISLKQISSVDHINSAKYSKEYIKINDSVQESERKSQEKFARIAYETDEIIQEKDNLAERNRTLLYVFVVSFIVVVLLFVLRAQRARTRELLYKQAQQKANEDIYNLMMSQQAIIDESRNKEKKRLAQDLHDGVLGRMFGLRLNLDSLNHNADQDSISKRFELLNELKTIEQDIREISHDLNREKQVLINNFVSIVHNLLEEQKNSHEANVSYTIDNDVAWDKVGNAIKINMYRILQEGLQNINKYANAKNIVVEVKGDQENVYLKIQDDGVGFDVNRKSKGIGMQNMISRTNDCQGIIDINSKKDNGTKIVITLPVETKQLIEEQE
jgi:signal transduction histidine kinase